MDAEDMKSASLSGLELATTDELIEELCRRCSVAAVAMIRPAEGNGDNEFVIRYSGGAAACLGILTLMRRQVIRSFEDES